jgi:hypothetical protein
MNIPKNIKEIQAQSRRLRCRMVDRSTIVVESTSNPYANHIVTVFFMQNGGVHARCTCPWATHNGVACSHVMAALEYLAGLKKRTLSFWSSKADAERQKQRTFRLAGDEDRGVWITSRNE